MLGVFDAEKIDQLWDQAALKAVLPVAEDEFFAVCGQLPDHRDCQRAYERYHLRRKAIVNRHSETYAIYVQDCSRMGMGIISPAQLFPRERIVVCMEGRSYQLEIKRCRRLAENCYACGTVFVLSL